MNITICFATNDNYAPHAAALIVSIMVNKRPEDELTFYCFSDNLSVGIRQQFCAMEQQWKFTLHFIEIDDTVFQHLPTYSGTWTPYFRLIMVRFLPDSLEKILYLDCDMIVMASLSELFATDIEGKYAAVVAEALSRPHLASLHLQYPYFNSGMVLFNLKQYRQDRMEERGFDFADKYRKMLHFADQDVFNVIFGGNVVFVPLKWNCIQQQHMTFSPRVTLYFQRLVGWRFPEGFLEQLAEAERQPCIIHYTNTKPWDGGCNSPFAGEYWKYVRQTPFYEQVRFSWQRIWRNVLNIFLLGAYPIVHHLIMIRKR